MALQTSASEIGVRDKSSEDYERREMFIGQWWIYKQIKNA
jgi:hypothetical protein